MASVSTESPAINDRGIRGGGAETASGMDIPGGLCGPEGWRDRASGVQLRTPGMYGRVFSFKLRNLVLLMSAGAIAKDSDQGLVVYRNEEICTAQDEVATALEGLGDCEGFTLNGCVSRLGRMSEPRPDKSDPPALLAAK